MKRNKPLMLMALMVSFAPQMATSAGFVEFETLARLPQPMSNNAVALAVVGDRPRLFSLFGLERGKTWRHVRSSAWMLDTQEKGWRQLPDPPGASGRLAAAAVAAAGSVWVFGGYTVAADGVEVSTPEVYRLDPVSGLAALATEMPVPVDDAVVMTYRDRYIYLVSGWHDEDNVDLVQVLDTRTLEWSEATPWPGAPVFGHAGGLSRDQMVVCDGVRTETRPGDDKRRFVASKECWLGRIDSEDHRQIAWQPLPVHPGRSRYRMAAAGDGKRWVVFAGGADNPYNYDGIGYDGRPAHASRDVFLFDFDSGSWRQGGALPVASMDHRSLPYFQGWFYLAGGMDDDQALTDFVIRFRVDPTR